MIPEMPTCRLTLTVTNPPSGGRHTFGMPGPGAREKKPITLAGRSGWLYLQPLGISTNYEGGQVVTVEADVVFDPPLTMAELLVMAGAEVIA